MVSQNRRIDGKFRSGWRLACWQVKIFQVDQSALTGQPSRLGSIINENEIWGNKGELACRLEFAKLNNLDRETVKLWFNNKLVLFCSYSPNMVLTND